MGRKRKGKGRLRGKVAAIGSAVAGTAAGAVLYVRRRRGKAPEGDSGEAPKGKKPPGAKKSGKSS